MISSALWGAYDRAVTGSLDVLTALMGGPCDDVLLERPVAWARPEDGNRYVPIPAPPPPPLT